MKNRSRSVFVIVVLSALCVLGIPMRGQVTGATVTGLVTDQSGAPIANATVAIQNVQTGIRTTVSSDSRGVYSAPNLLPDSYEVTVTSAGFSTQVTQGVVLAVGAEQTLNVKMKVGEISQQVTVTNAAPAIDLSDASLTNQVDGVTVRELPLNGRDWTQLAALQPGVGSLGSLQPPPQAGYGRGNRGYGTQLSISGARPQQNNYRIDGVSVNDYANSGPGSVLGSTLGVDAIQEFSVITTNYPAEYGRVSGGVVNAVTRSGTNAYHGDAYSFFRNSVLDARNYFDAAKPPFYRYQYGGALGGPIRKGKTFFFADYEGVIQSLGVSAVNRTLSPNARNGILQAANGGTTSVTVDPAVIPFLALYPLPNGPITGDVGIYTIATQQETKENFVTARIDHKFSDRDTIAGTYQYDKSLLTLPDNLNTVTLGNQSHREFASIAETHAFSSQLLNNLRFGYNRESARNGYGVRANNPAAADPALAAIPGQFAPSISISGVAGFGGGLGTPPNYNWLWNSYQIYDDVLLTKGKHNLKFGVTIEHMQEQLLAEIGVGGGYNFGTLAGFLTNQPLRFNADISKQHTPRNFNQVLFGSYMQDDFRVYPNLTLNLGVRYEMVTVPVEASNRFTNLRNIADPSPSTTGSIFQNPTKLNFEPRVGFAWDAFGNGKTSVRSGFAMVDVLPMTFQFIIPESSAAPYTTTGSVSTLPQGAFPTGGLGLVTAAPHLRNVHIQSDPRRNYVMQWDLDIEQAIGPNFTAMMGYVGSRSVHQAFRADDVNIVLPTATPQGYLWPCNVPFVDGVCPTPGKGSTKVNPVSGRIDNLSWGSNAFYHALEVQLTKRLNRGFQVQGSYTWSKSIDEGSASSIGDPFANSISSLFSFDRRLRRGLSDFDIRQNAVVNATWTLPKRGNANAVEAALANGWEVGGIYQIRSGLPFTPLVGGDPLGLNSNDPFAYPNRTFDAGCSSPVNAGKVDYLKLGCFSFPRPSTLLGNIGRNSVIGPRLSNFDLSLFKNNYVARISDVFNVQLRAELFNVLNHTNFNSPTDNLALFDQNGLALSGAGAVSSTSTTSRQIQLAVKVVF